VAITDNLPGMKPNETGRNVAVGIGYLFVGLFVLAFFPIVLGVIVGTNWRGTADKLTALPGVAAGGGAKAGVVAGVYGFVLWGLLMAVGGGEEAQSSASDAGSSDEETGDYTVVVTVVDDNNDPIENAEVEFVHDDAIIFNTREDQQTNQDGQATFETEGGSITINAEADGYESGSADVTIESDDEVTIALDSELEPEPEEADDSSEDEASSGIEQLASETYGTSGLVTGLSPDGETVLFGFGDGNVMVYDEQRDGDVVDLETDRSVSHLQVSEDGTTATVGWMDADMYGSLDLSEDDGPALQHPELWDLDTTADGTTIASVSSPVAGPGSVTVSANGEIQWETELGESIGQTVAITDDGSHVAVGAGHYWGDGVDRHGAAGVKLYDDTGTEQWTHTTDEDVLSVDVDNDRELVVAGTDDGKTIVLDLEGNVIWETESYGGWVSLSQDGSTIVTSEGDGTLYAVDAETGDERWTASVGFWAAEDVSVSANGDRVLVGDRGNGEIAVVDSGEVIWENTYDVGPAIGALSGDGSTWSISIQDNDNQSGEVEIYSEN
jgi:WD40 repeat protein